MKRMTYTLLNITVQQTNGEVIKMTQVATSDELPEQPNMLYLDKWNISYYRYKEKQFDPAGKPTYMWDITNYVKPVCWFLPAQIRLND